MKKTAKLIYIIVFFGVVLLPTVLTVAGVQTINYEKRALAAKPVLVEDSINIEYTQDFDIYFADNFALRPYFVTAYAKVAKALFNTSTSDRVILGKNSFLFFAQTLPTYTGQDALTDEEIDTISEKIWEEQIALQKQGKAFLFVVAPNKNTLYPKNMPNRYTMYKGQSNMTRLYAKMQDYGINYIDLTLDLEKAKTKEQIYHNDDSHWNNFGAVVGYTSIMQKVEAILGTNDYVDFLSLPYTQSKTHKGDLATMLYPASDARDDQMHYAYTKAYTSARPIVNLEALSIVTQNDQANIKALIFRDSFFNALIPFFSQSLGYVQYSRSVPYDFAYAGDQDVDIVILEIVERNIPLLVDNIK